MKNLVTAICINRLYFAGAPTLMFGVTLSTGMDRNGTEMDRNGPSTSVKPDFTLFKI